MTHPIQPAPFEGRIGRTLAESEPHFASRPHPGADAPNVVIVLLDDTGFAQFGCYGSDIDTPHVDALAAADYHLSEDLADHLLRMTEPFVARTEMARQ